MMRLMSQGRNSKILSAIERSKLPSEEHLALKKTPWPEALDYVALVGEYSISERLKYVFLLFPPAPPGINEDFL